MEHKLKEWVRGGHEKFGEGFQAKFGEGFTQSSQRFSRKVRRG